MNIHVTFFTMPLQPISTEWEMFINRPRVCWVLFSHNEHFSFFSRTVNTFRYCIELADILYSFFNVDFSHSYSFAVNIFQFQQVTWLHHVPISDFGVEISEIFNRPTRLFRLKCLKFNATRTRTSAIRVSGMHKKTLSSDWPFQKPDQFLDSSSQQYSDASLPDLQWISHIGCRQQLVGLPERGWYSA